MLLEYQKHKRSSKDYGRRKDSHKSTHWTRRKGNLTKAGD